ncbi:MAG: hypothetical protein AAF720_01950 [Pseudomonadota bacterium]
MTRLVAKRSMRISVVPPRVGKTRAQISSEMTRLEFERERIAREIRTIESRLIGLKASRVSIDGRISKLHSALFSLFQLK